MTTPVPPTPPFDVVEAIMAFEAGESDYDGTLKLFAHLIASGLAWQLQGSYGRAAAELINQGVITRTGEIVTDLDLID